MFLERDTVTPGVSCIAGHQFTTITSHQFNVNGGVFLNSEKDCSYSSKIPILHLVYQFLK